MHLLLFVTLVSPVCLTVAGVPGVTPQRHQDDWYIHYIESCPGRGHYCRDGMGGWRVEGARVVDTTAVERLKSCTLP